MKLLIKLMDETGISGNEERVRNIISKEIEKHVDEIKIDKLGNLVCVKKGKSPKVMLAAHMDEVGLMVSEIQNDGNIKCIKIGGINSKFLAGQRMHIEAKEKIPAVGRIRKKKGKIAKGDITVKTKFSKKELLKKGVEIGSYVSYASEAKIVKDKYIQGKALDDRIGCFMLIELAKKLKKTKNEIYFVFTVQEEVGLHGAKTSAFELEPDWAIAVETTPIRGTSRSKKTAGKGPVITIKDRKFIANKCINGWLKEMAAKNKIPLQFNVSDKGSTDAAEISLSRGGVPSSVVAVGVKDIHSAEGRSSIKDIKSALKLLYELMRNPPKVCLV